MDRNISFAALYKENSQGRKRKGGDRVGEGEREREKYDLAIWVVWRHSGLPAGNLVTKKGSFIGVVGLTR
jgi:hypothetical protein